MDLLRKDPRAAYYSNALFLPKAFISEPQLRGSLTYDMGNDKAPYEAWTNDRHHYIVPRGYIAETSLGAMPFPVYDARWKHFPQVKYACTVTLDAKSKGGTYQRDGTAALLACNSGILSLRCGAGKSVCAIYCACRLGVPALILVNDLGLARQWVHEILDFTNLTEEDIGFIGKGRFDWKKPICVASVQTVAARVRDGTLPREMVQWFGVTIADEAHNTAGPAYYHTAMTPFHGRRWGLTATPRRNDGFDSLLKYTIGPVVYSYLIPELVPLIYFRRLPTHINTRDPAVLEAITDVTGEEHLQKIYGYLATRDDRTKIIIAEAKEAMRQGRQLLILSQSVAMVERLAREFPNGAMIHGKVDMDERLDLIKTKNPVIAISKLGRQALNKPTLDTLFLCEPYTDENMLQQIIGRLQRDHVDKQQALVVLYDDVHIPRLHKMLMRVRSLFNRWPEFKGGRMRWQATGDASL